MAVQWDTTPHSNPDPFNEAENKDETDIWAKNLASAESRGAKSSTSSDPERKDSQHSHNEALTVTHTLSKAAHTAKEKLHLHHISAAGPWRGFFNPTNVHVHLGGKDDEGVEHAFIWRSRDNRKGRNSIAVPSRDPTARSTPLRSRIYLSLGRLKHGIWQMCTTFRYWDMAYWSGWSYSIGSVLFVMDGAWAWQSVAYPDRLSENLITYGPSLCFFFGALLYQVGAVMAYLECVNDGSFQGSAMRRFLEGHEDDSKKMLDEKLHTFFGHLVPHHHHKETDGDIEKMPSVDPEEGWRRRSRGERPFPIYPPGKGPAPRRGGIDLGETEEGTSSEYMTWRWYPTWHMLRTHHVYEIGYVACAIQLFGATLYGICGLVDLPGILSSLKPWQEEGAFWVPQIVASCCFLTAGILFTVESQENWYRPEPAVLGWWIGFWATVGSCGFLCVNSRIFMT